MSVTLFPTLSDGKDCLRSLLLRGPQSDDRWALSLLNRTDDRVLELQGGEILLSDSERVSFSTLAEDFRPFAESMYVGPHRQPITQGGGDHYDIQIGTAFIKQWDDWKTGNNVAHNRIIQDVTDEIGRIFGFSRFDIVSAQNQSALHVTIDGNPYRLRELGAGLAQFVVTLAAVAIRRPQLLLIDEPEIHLHPSLQVELLTSWANHVSFGIVFATHSVGLARRIADRIYTFRLEGQRSIVRLLDDTPNVSEFLGEMSFSAYRELGYKSLLLVEGVSDVRVVMQFLQLLDAQHGIVVFPLGGDALTRGGVDVELAELTRLADHVYALVDSEKKSKKGKPIKSRRDFAALCNKLTIKAHLTERRSLD